MAANPKRRTEYSTVSRNRIDPAQYQDRTQNKDFEMRDAAYQGLLRDERRRLHADVARSMSGTGYGDEQIAHHFQEGGLFESAARHWQAAGQRALRENAYVDADAHLRAALEALAQAADSAELTRLQAQLLARHVAAGTEMAATFFTTLLPGISL